MKRFEILASSDRSRPEAKAWDRVFCRFAAVKRFPTGLSPQSTGAPLMKAWEQWMTAPHPTFLRPAVLDFRLGWLVREWASGFSLLELLRRRHKLTARETLMLLRAAPGALDHAARHGMLPDLALDKFFVQFEGAVESERAGDFLKEPVERWPAWSLRIEPLRLANHLSDTGSQTVLRLAPLPRGVVPAVAMLQQLLRELSGGALGRPDAPVAAFSDAANAVLARALRPDGFAAAQELFDAVYEESPDDAPEVREESESPARTFALRAGEGAVGEVLTLEPLEAPARPLKLVSRREIRLGRSEIQADLAARFLGEAEQASEMVQRVSRVHTRLRQEDDARLRIYDGSEAAPSQNGTWVDAGQVSHEAGAPLHGMLALRLGNHWLATLLPAPAPRENVQLRSSGPSGTQRRWGAVFFVPWPGCGVVSETVWLLEEAGFGIDSGGALMWDSEGLDSAPAAFRAEQGAFFLLNRRLPDEEISVDGVPLRAGEAAAVGEGMRIRIGGSQWKAAIG